jgi:uncharacterized protein
MNSIRCNGKVIASEFKFCKTFFSQLRGLMFSRKKVLIFDFGKEINLSLHMWFVFFPIDVLFLDANKKIVEVKEGLKPFCFYFPSAKFRYCVELPFKVKCKKGEKLRF